MYVSFDHLRLQFFSILLVYLLEYMQRRNEKAEKIEARARMLLNEPKKPVNVYVMDNKNLDMVSRTMELAAAASSMAPAASQPAAPKVAPKPVTKKPPAGPTSPMKPAAAAAGTTTAAAVGSKGQTAYSGPSSFEEFEQVVVKMRPGGGAVDEPLKKVSYLLYLVLANILSL